VVFCNGSILGHLLFILHINDLPHGMNTYSKPVLFSDDTSVSMTANNLNDLQIRSASVVNYTVHSDWIVSEYIQDKCNKI
jgi:hypothetical protein